MFYFDNNRVFFHKVKVKTGLYLWLIIGFIAGQNVATAQPLPIVQEKQSKESFESARSLYELKAYPEALKIYVKLLGDDPENSNLNFLVGDCMMNISGYENEALPYMKKAVKNVVPDYENLIQQRKAPVFALEKLGDLLYQDYEFEQALLNYRSFRTYLDVRKDKPLLDEVNHKIEVTLMAKQQVDNPLKLTLTELPFVNVISFYDYGARMSSDGNTIYFSRKRATVAENPGSSDIYYMRKVEGKWGRPVRMPFINTDADDDFCWISDDDNQMIICSNRDGKYHLYSTVRKGKSQWTLPEPFNSNINSKGEETFGCISNDGKTLYFVSDRKGGTGGKDIYRSQRPAGADWGPAENLGTKVNTSQDEETPFLSRDGKTLYFSSKGQKTMGGFDVFYVTVISPTSFTDPVNAGYPLNTTGDDLYYNHSFQGKPDYFISRSRADKNEFSISVLNSSETVTTLTETKSKVTPQDKTKLKLVPKTLKY